MPSTSERHHEVHGDEVAEGKAVGELRTGLGERGRPLNLVEAVPRVEGEAAVGRRDGDDLAPGSAGRDVRVAALQLRDGDVGNRVVGHGVHSFTADRHDAGPGCRTESGASTVDGLGHDLAS